MRSVLPLLALGAALAGPATAAAAPVPALRGVGITNIGTKTPLAEIDEELDEVAALGATTLRADISWAGLEPAQGELDAGYLERIDRLVTGSRKRGIRPLFVVLRSPCWASSAPAAPGRCDEETVTYPPRDPDDYGAIVGRLAKRYAGRLAGFEIWNEPDHEQEFYFAGPDKPQRYAALLKAAHREIKRADPSARVIAGSLVGADGAFLEALYAAGIKGSYDGLAIHYYNLTFASIRNIRRVQRANGDTSPLWLTEFGWTSCWPRAKTQDGHACVTREQQARNLADIFRALGRAPYVRAAIVYNLRDAYGGTFGLASAGGARKPAFATLRRAFAGRLGGPRPVAARVRNGRLTGRAPAGDVVLVQGFRGAQFVYSATLAPDRFGRFALSLPGELRGARVVVSQEWTGRSKTVYP